MKLLPGLVVACCSLAAQAQVVHPGGAATVVVNWNPVSVFHYYPSPDSLVLDVDGDQLPDVKFLVDNYSFYFPNDSPGRKLIFSVQVRRGDVQLAADSVAPGSAHRFQAGGAIGRGLQWVSPLGAATSCLAYFPVGAFGPAAVQQGSFRDGQPGYIVVRKQQASGTWRYWWLNVANQYAAATATQQAHVNFYGSSLATPLAAALPTPPATGAYPNPTTGSWQLPAGNFGTYRLLDSAGRVVGQGLVRPGQRVVEGQALSPGLYWLEYREQGPPTRQLLSKE